MVDYVTMTSIPPLPSPFFLPFVSPYSKVSLDQKREIAGWRGGGEFLLSFFVSVPRMIILHTLHTSLHYPLYPSTTTPRTKEGKKAGRYLGEETQPTYESQRAEKEKEGIARDGADQGSTPTNQKPGE
jgi:hypothetical protein